MSVGPGARLGPYVLQSALGAGGMGEVYKARDIRLDRVVAVKVLPSRVSDDPSLRERFEREARAVAALNHPHICTLHDVGHQDGVDYLVLEYLEGQTLANRLTKGALPVDQALAIAIQICGALDKAHRAGIVHRDLKPGNIMLTKSGAKLLDFGLAKIAVAVPAGSGASILATAPNMTAQGTILGTFQYMSPEQLEGQDADSRTDIFAFGAVLYEMVTGRVAFEGKSQASLIAAILEREPPPMSALVHLVPSALERIVKTCLEKEPDNRWQSARDIARELRWVSEGRTSLVDSERRVDHSHRRAWILGCLLAITTMALIIALIPAVAHLREAPIAEPETRFEVQTKPRFDDTVAISPDGRRLAFEGLVDGKWQLWTQTLDSLTARPIPGTDGATYPFWSPDGRTLGFFAEGKLKRVSIDGGPPQVLASAPEARGGTWGRDGTIVFAPTISSALSAISATGGRVRPATHLQTGQVSHRFPSLLPDGRHVLYLSQANGAANGVLVSALDGSLDKRLFDADSAAVYASPGVLLFRRQQALVGQRFDPVTLSAIGDPFSVSDVVGSGPNFGSLAVSTADVGTLVFRARSEQGGARQLTWFDRSGTKLGVVGGAFFGPLNAPDLSPNGDRVALHTTVDGNIDTWIVDVARGVRSRLTTDLQADQFPVWSPDGNQIAFNSARRGSFDLYRTSARGNGPEELLLENPGTTMPSSWSSDGRSLLYTQLNPDTGFDLYVLPLDGARKPVVFANRAYDEENGQFSNDMRWIAYESNESGRFEVFVQPYSAPASKWQISTDGGKSPRWRADGKELFFVTPDGTLMGVSIAVSRDGTGIDVGTAVPLVRGQMQITGYTTAGRGNYAVTPDGQRFLVVAPLAEAPTPITVVLNWKPKR